MIELLKQSLTAQFEASLRMMHQCIEVCPDELWEAKIANATVRWVAYHALFFTDYYLSSEESFQLRELHARGGDEREDRPCEGLSRVETLEYATTCRQKAVDTIAGETVGSLQAPMGFSWLKFSRLEGHLYNVRHIQHHTGQLSAFLRRQLPQLDPKSLRWVRSGWM